MESVKVAVYFARWQPQDDYRVWHRMACWLWGYHVSALVMTEAGSVYVQPGWRGIRVFPVSVRFAGFMCPEEDVEDVVVVEAQWGASPMFGFDILTCVSVVKRILGIRDWRVQTPRQLHRRLREHG